MLDAIGTIYVYVLISSIVSFYHSAQQCYTVLTAGSLQTVWTVQHVSIFWLHSESNVNQWWDIRHFSCFAAKAAGLESLTVAAGMAQLDQMVRSGAVSVVETSWQWFCFQSFFYFQCVHCARVQFQLQYPGTLRRKCAGGSGWNGWRESDWHLGVMPCLALA